MKQRCILLYAKPYSMEREDKTVAQGISLYYLPVGDLSPISDSVGNFKGVQPCKQSIPIEFGSHLKSLPGIYDIVFELRTVQNKPNLVPVGFEYISDVVIKSDGGK